MSQRPDDVAARGTPAWRWLLVIVPAVVLIATSALMLAEFAKRLEAPVAPPPERESRPTVDDIFTTPPRLAVPEPAEPQATFEAARVVALLASADQESGGRHMAVCTICHSAEKGAAHKLAPNLWNVVGRRKAGHRDFRYSDALRNKRGAWTYEELATFLNNPRRHVPGTSMAFAGIRDEQKLANILAHLRTLADDPVPLPN